MLSAEENDLVSPVGRWTLMAALEGVRFRSNGAVTTSLVMRSTSGTVRRVEASSRQAKPREYRLLVEA